ncbi:hypothetical protein Dda_8990 [Drechslerella dactyloides]|uniref:Protein Zds1 C-terminal domain-containing protein n=1 Tax=Drechslerella dactyloides TaxID=74499 RepID=A0AAD6IRD8_DREDA|nr:hypothetical protein Dda_8990 [Drechslerella dactyloides]
MSSSMMKGPGKSFDWDEPTIDQSNPASTLIPTGPYESRGVAELAFSAQYEDPASRSIADNLVYLQTLIFLILEADNRGPAAIKGQFGPPRALWLGAAIGLAYNLRLHHGNAGAGPSGGDHDDSDEKLGRRAWWALVVLDRWNAVSTSSPLHIPDSSVVLLPEDQALLGTAAYHITRLSMILGHLAESLTSSDQAVSTPAGGAYVSRLLRGELERFRESVDSVLGSLNLVHIAYWHVKLLFLRLNDATEPSQLIVPATRIAAILNSVQTPVTPLSYHFAALAILTLVDLLDYGETRMEAERGITLIAEALETRRGISTREDSAGWDRTIKDFIARRTGQTFHSRQESLGDHEHVTAAIGDLYGGSDDEGHDAEDDYGQPQRWQQHTHHNHQNTLQPQQPQQHTARYHRSQTLPVTPPHTPTKTRKAPSHPPRTPPPPPPMDNPTPTSPISGSPTLRVPGSPGATQAFPLNNLDYESNPDAVQQELENLQALRRLSMDVTTVPNDPDLPSFNNFFPSVAPKQRGNDDDAARLFWVPARLHPELAPKAFKNFVESRVEQIREHEGGNLSADGSLQATPSLRRKKSMLSRQIDTEGKAADGYEDGADKLRRARSDSDGEPVLTVSELGEVLGHNEDPADLMRQLSLNKTEKALMGEPSQLEDDQPMFPVPPPGGALRRSTRTALRRAAAEEGKGGEEPEFKLSRVRTEPIPSTIPSISISSEDEGPGWQENNDGRPSSKGRDRAVPVYGDGAKRLISTPPGLSKRPTSPPELTTSERMIRSKSDPETSPPMREPPAREPPPAPAPQQKSPPTIERKELSPRGREAKVAAPNGQSTTPSPSPSPPAPIPPPSVHTTVTAEPAAPKAKRPPLKRGSPGTSSYEPSKEPPTASLPVPPTDGKRKDASNHTAQSSAPTKEVGRKASWGWLSLGSDDKEKDKGKERDRESGGKKVRKARSIEKDRDKEEEKERKREIKRERERERERERAGGDREHARLDLIPKSIEGLKKRESIDSNFRPSMESIDREKDRDKDKEKDKSSKKGGSAEKEKDKDKKESGIFSSIFGGSKKKQEEAKAKSKPASSSLTVPQNHRSKSPPVQTYYYTRFPIHIERAIYRLSHLKLANPRRPLLQQVLLSNFMYAYLAKVQQMQPNGPQAGQGGQQAQQQASQQQQQQYQQQQAHEQYHQQQQHGGAVNGDEGQQMESDEEEYDFDDDGRDDRGYDPQQQGYVSRGHLQDGGDGSNGGYQHHPHQQQDYDGGGYEEYQDDQEYYHQQGGGNGREGHHHAHGNGVGGGYGDKDYEYYDGSEVYEGDGGGGEGGGYDGGAGGMVMGTRYHHQQSGGMNDDRDRDYSDDMW